MFLADVPSVGFKVFHVSRSRGDDRVRAATLRVTPTSLENSRDILSRSTQTATSRRRSIDKDAKHELLKAPVRARDARRPVARQAGVADALRDGEAPVREYVAGPPVMRIVEHGPVRAAIEITRQARRVRRSCSRSR